MKNGILYTILCSFLAILCNICQAQEQKEDKTIFSDLFSSSRRYSTSEKDKKSGVLLPKYDEIASDRDKGITLDDWEKQCLSFERFELLDENGDGIISKEEMDNDDFMGEAEIFYPPKELIKKYCKDEFPDYEERKKLLKDQGFSVDKLDPYVVNTKKNFKDGITPPLAICSQYPGSTDVATKTYINLKDGWVAKKRLDIGHYALLLMRDQKEQESTLPYLFGAVLLAIVVVVTILTPKLL